jgi:hypothetical protein
VSNLTVPRRGKGNQSFADRARFEQEMRDFAAGILQIKSTIRLSRMPGIRGWCYILEEHGLPKGDFNLAVDRINQCRKNGLLPIDICGEDASRAATDNAADDHSEYDDPAEFARDYFDYYAKVGRTQAAGFTPIPWTKGLDYEVFIMVEKSDLVTLFEDACNEYHVPISNAKGWGDLNSRANLMRRFRDAEDEGRQPVLLYCGDHDPWGLQICDNLPKMLGELAIAVGWDPSGIIVDRFGLNADFIEQHNLSWIEGLETSSGKDLGSSDHFLGNADHVRSYIKQFGERKVEANALVVRPDAADALVREAIGKYIPIDWPTRHARRNAKARKAALAAYDARTAQGTARLRTQ